MKETAIAIAVALVGFVTVAQAASKDNTWYADTKLGWSQYYNTGFIPNNGPTHENQLGAGALGSYQVNLYIGLEMGCDQLDCMPYKGDNINGAYKARGVQLTAKLGYPITDGLDIYTRPGGMIWHADTKANVSGSVSSKDYDTGVSPVFVGGVEYVVIPEVITCLEYQWTNNVDDTHTVSTRLDNGILSLGASYRLGRGEVVPVTTPAPVPAPEVQTKHFILKPDVLFTFNEAALGPEGQAAPDQLYSQLSNLNPEDGSTVVLDYTGRIGPDTYNQVLPEHRVQSVVDYLIPRGIPADKTSARGMGESNPITDSTCDNVKQCVALIDCLALDRYVKIEVKGIKDVVAQSQV